MISTVMNGSNIYQQMWGGQNKLPVFALPDPFSYSDMNKIYLNQTHINIKYSMITLQFSIN